MQNYKKQTYRDRLYASAKSGCRSQVDDLVRDSVRSSAQIEGIYRSKASLEAKTPRRLDRTPPPQNR